MVGDIGYVTYGCNKQSRRSRGSEPETKPVTSVIYQRKMEGGLRECVSIWQVVIVLSRQLVLAMFVCIMGISGRTQTAETVMSHELNVHYVKNLFAKVFNFPHLAHKLLFEKGKNHLK